MTVKNSVEITAARADMYTSSVLGQRWLSASAGVAVSGLRLQLIFK